MCVAWLVALGNEKCLCFCCKLHHCQEHPRTQGLDFPNAFASLFFGEKGYTDGMARHFGTKVGRTELSYDWRVLLRSLHGSVHALPLPSSKGKKAGRILNNHHHERPTKT